MKIILNEIDAKFSFDCLTQILQESTIGNRNNIRKLNRVLLSIINQIADAEQQVFLSYQAKINFVVQSQNIDGELEKRIYAMQKFAQRILLNPDFNPTEHHFAFCLRLTAEIISYFSSQPVPSEISNFYADFPIPVLQTKNSEKRIGRLFAVFIAEVETLVLDEFGAGNRVILCNTQGGKPIKIALKDEITYLDGKVKNRYNLASESVLLKKGDDFLISQIERIDEDFFASTENTHLILSPDHLYDATKISRCFYDENTYSGSGAVLARYLPFMGNSHTLTGNIANSFLDNLVSNPDLLFEEAFALALEDNTEDITRLSPDIEQIKKFVFPEFEKIKTVLKNIKGNLTTEPTFISELHGLQGRLDLLNEPTDDRERKDIIELKSTKMSNYPYDFKFEQHKVQVACYDLLLSRQYAGRRGTSSVLYSRREKDCLVDSGKLSVERKNLALLRNQILFFEKEIADRNFEIFDKLISDGSDMVKKGLSYGQENAFEDLKKILSGADALLKAYFYEFSGFIFREIFAARIGNIEPGETNGGYSALWNATREEKKENFALIDGLVLIAFDKKTSTAQFSRTNGDISSFRQADMLILYPYTADKLSVFGQQILKGTLTEVDADNLTVLLWHKSVNENFFSLENEKGEERFWAIEPAFQEKNYETQLQALWQIMNISPEKADIFFGKKAPRFDENFRLDYTGKGLNEKQNYVLSKALAAKDYAVLQGPPGTGKTSKMLKNMAHFLFHETNETVVLLAFTNRATDEICEKIKEVCGDNFIRLGNSPDKKWAQYGLRASKSPKEAQQKFAQCRFFVGTVSSFPNFAGMIKQKNTVIIDEASQLLEPHLCGILPFFDRFILIGDEKQLPAVVAQNENLCRVRDENLKNIGILSFSQSLFERLLRNAQKNQWTHAYEMLSDQYRTHEEIANFINKHFYDGKLYPAGLWQREKKSVFGAQTPEFLANNRLIFIECENENLVKVNKSEARTVLQLLLMLREALGDEFTESSVGVITPFRAQIAEITSLLDNTLRKKVTVDTVERFQGSERDIIILSTAVNSKKSAVNIQSLNEEMTVDKKLNVALSRAKKQLILLGNAEILSATHFYGKLLREISCKIHCSECNYVPMRMS